MLPERVSNGALISGLAPADRPKPYEGFTFTMKMLIFLARSVPSLVYPFRRLTYNMLQGDPEKAGDRLASSFPPEDLKAINESGSKTMLVENIKEGYRQGGEGPAQDDIIINSSWGFSLEDIQTRFDVWQGDVDKNVPVNLGEYQHEVLPNSRLRILPGQAHLYLLTHWREILERLVT
jgi:pimeloyl-ACP methyl ester carboxylesterase